MMPLTLGALGIMGKIPKIESDLLVWNCPLDKNAMITLKEEDLLICCHCIKAKLLFIKCTKFEQDL